MSQHFNNFSIEDAQRLAQTEAGRKILSLLQSQPPAQLQAAMKQASAGEYDQLKQTLGTFLASPEAQTLMKQLEKHTHE